MAIVGGVAAWALGNASFFLAAGMVLAGCILLARLGFQHDRAERLAAKLCGLKHRQPLLTSLAALSVQLDDVRHRMSKSHPVTGLPTRERLSTDIAYDIGLSKTPHLLGAIRFTDFDRLAAFDQPAANAALTCFAARLQTATRSVHVVGQIDRDCFGIWFRGDGDLEAASAEFRSIVYVAGQEILDPAITLTPSIEASAVRFPKEGADASQLLLRVTAALAKAQPVAGGEVSSLENDTVEVARERFVLEQELTRAIAQEQLTMMFQPVVDLAQGRVISAEALLRWDHPQFGSVSPGRFFPIVESLGMSERYGLWVLNAACKQVRFWRDQGLDRVKVAVNLSARQLLDPGLRAKIERTLERHRLTPDALELELTETAAMADAKRTVELFGELRAMGVSLAVDDFGSGYSSLSYLKNLPFDKLKIDREFVTNVDSRRDSRAICKALIELGRGLDLLVLAEGVENEKEVAVLTELGCSVFQGYYFSKPISSEAFLALALDPQWTRSLKRAPAAATRKRRSFA